VLLNMAVADAYAIPFEFIDKSEYPGPNDLKTFYKHPKYHELKLGQYTDDTQRSIANFNVVMCGEIFNITEYARQYVEVYKQDPREGYSRGYQDLLRNVETADDFLLACTRSKNSNGSVMGAAVLGLIKEPEFVKLAATAQACATHLHHTATHAQIVALAAHYTLYDLGPKDEIQSWVMQTLDEGAFRSQEAMAKWLIECQETEAPTRIAAASISAFVIGAIRRHDTMSGILREAVDRGGDTDSAAAAAIAVASHCPEIDDDLPAELFEGLERGPFGFDYLKELDETLSMYIEEQVS
jgi:ADP-ribosyl-[dinitrogen reductase] hydrolase